MKIIYHCHQGTPCSAVAAAIHLGRLSPGGWEPEDNRPRGQHPEGHAVVPEESAALPEDIAAVPGFRDAEAGRIVSAGTDEAGNQVCFLTRPGASGVASRALEGMAAILDPGGEGVKLVDVSPGRGGILSGGLSSLAAALLSPEHRVRADFPRLVRLVERVRGEFRTSAHKRPGQPERSGQPVRQYPLVFYHCFGSAHSSVIASAIHLGRLPQERTPSPEEIARLEHFDRLPHGLIGLPIRVGTDTSGLEVYIIGLGGARLALRKSVGSLITILGLPPDKLVMIDALTGANLLTRIGGFLSRRLGLVCLGRPLCIAGVRRDYPRFVRLVRQAKDALRKGDLG